MPRTAARGVRPFRVRTRRETERRADPEAPLEIDELRIGSCIRRWRHGLERHAADRAVSRRVAHDLGVHRTRIAGARGRRIDGGAVPEEFFRGRFEARPAPPRAEEVPFAGVRGEVLGRRAMHPHSAHRIDGLEVRLRCRGELLAAWLRAEVVSVPRVDQRDPSSRGIDLHSAHGVSCNRLHGRFDGRLHREVRGPGTRGNVGLPATGSSRAAREPAAGRDP